MLSSIKKIFGSKTARNSAQRNKRRQQRREGGRQLILESLEDRRLLAANFSITSPWLVQSEDGSTAFTFVVSKSGGGSGSVNYSVTGNGAVPATAADFGGTFPRT